MSSGQVDHVEQESQRAASGGFVSERSRRCAKGATRFTFEAAPSLKDLRYLRAHLRAPSLVLLVGHALTVAPRVVQVIAGSAACRHVFGCNEGVSAA